MVNLSKHKRFLIEHAYNLLVITTYSLFPLSLGKIRNPKRIQETDPAISHLKLTPSEEEQSVQSK